MKIPQSRQRGSLGANMTPMIDVVFLLIIFFLVSSHLARRESRLPMDLPGAQTSADADPQRAALTINIDQAGRIVVHGVAVSPDDLLAILNDHLRRNESDAAVRVRAHRFAAYRSVEPVLRTVADTGIHDVRLSVQKSRVGGATR
ncbi:ExbD/TolR family protein [Crateriforma conspicua]|uniref:Biopolymer transport protein ExbD n=1 Tax=Crateriforma conspicua TaxID=2527996 RepID=A0A5C5Y9R3_9PLAN|nr:biopolymer transporter ExbD [Crateriforma conspicua]QDV62162.1 biopolymer transport protein ExbD [Crateriforma conspicua]TWT71669.1 biopolymer transport protein ExbD [Crateriforma conspicua]